MSFSWIKNERRYNDVIKFADHPQQSCYNMHFSLTTAFQRGCLNVILDLISSTILVLLILSSFLNSSEHKQVSTRAEVFASRGVWRKSTAEKEETNAFLCKQVPLDAFNMVVYNVTSFIISQAKIWINYFRKSLFLPVMWCGFLLHRQRSGVVATEEKNLKNLQKIETSSQQGKPKGLGYENMFWC